MTQTTLHARGPVAEPALSAASARLSITVVCHTVIDFYAFLIPPLLTVLEGRLHLTAAQGAFLLALGSVVNGAVQPLVAWLSDRHNTRVWGWLGLAMAVIGVGSVGYAQSYGQLLIIQIFAGVGIGAFHPIAAAAAGRLSGLKRTFGVAAFYCAGMAGGIAGNITGPYWVGAFGEDSVAQGLRSIAWLIPGGLLFAAALFWAIHRVPHRHAGAHQAHADLSPAERRSRWRAVGWLYFGNVMRFTADMAVILLISRWSEHMVLAMDGGHELTAAVRQHASEMSGPLQAAKQLGMGACGLLAGWLLSARYERLALILSPIVGAAAIMSMPWCTGWLALVVTVIAGIGYGGLVPVTISLAQRLLPHRTSLASGLMMGGAWCVGSLGSPLAQRVVTSYGLKTAFVVVGCISLLAAVGPLMLSKRLVR